MNLVQTARDVVRVVRDRELPFMAAAIAHYVFVSLVPLLVLTLAVTALVGSQSLIESLVRDHLASVLSENGQLLVVSTLTSVRGAVGAGVLSVVFALWSGSKVFRGFVIAFRQLYGVDTSPPLREQLRDAVVIVGLLVLVVAAMVATSVVVSVAALPVASPAVVGSVLLLVALVACLLPVYYVLTPIDSTLLEILPGTVLSSVGLVGLQLAFVHYVRYAAQYRALGLLGAILLFVSWLYFGGIVVLLGGALNYVTSREDDERVLA